MLIVNYALERVINHPQKSKTEGGFNIVKVDHSVTVALHSASTLASTYCRY